MGIGNFMDSKILALSVLILLIATIVSVGCSLLPFWFKLHFSAEDATYGSLGSREATLELGMFWLYKPNKPGPERTKVLMTSLTALEKAANLQVVPPLFKMAQVFYTIGVFGIAASFGGAIILAVRELGSLTGNFGLAGFAFLSAICQVAGVVFAIFVTLGRSTWHMMPLEDPYRIVIDATPQLILDWGYFIAVIGAGLSLFGAILLWIEALKICKSVEGIRRHQLTTKRAPEPYPDIRYERFSYANVPKPRPEYPGMHGHTTPGMVLSRTPQPPVFITVPQPSPQPPRYGGYQPSPEPSPRMPQDYKPPSVSREVNI